MVLASSDGLSETSELLRRFTEEDKERARPMAHAHAMLTTMLRGLG